jgi:ubiquinone/menaquinone biosynthesis C-methylase UbiE
LEIRIEAVTISPLQKDQALERIEKLDLGGRINVRQGNFHHLPDLYPVDCFDTVVFLESLSHAISVDEALRGAYTVLKPGGVLYIKDFFRKYCDSKEEQDRVDGVIENVNRTFRVITPNCDRVVGIVSDLGFEEIFVTPVQFTIDHEVWNKFDEIHDFDLYDGETPFPWSDWLELKFRKPFPG